MRFFGRIVLVLFAVAAIGTATYYWFKYRAAFTPNTGARQYIVILIPTGALFQQVVDSLHVAGAVDDTAAFRWTAVKKKYTGRVKPGRYVISPGSTNNDLVNKLRSGEQDPVRITFTNVKSLAQLAGRVAGYLECDSMAMWRAMSDRSSASRFGFDQATFPAMFIPNTYEAWWTDTPEIFLQRMAREYKRFWTEERKAKATALNFSQSEVSTLASIVQAETARTDDAPTIAGVYLNRLRIGMPLQADPTLVYALGLDSANRVLDVHKQVNSPYNTYLNKGLPPGPINLPEPRNIDAVLKAASHDYLYFCAREDLSGYSNFARTYDQHLVNARRYQRALNRRKIYR